MRKEIQEFAEMMEKVMSQHDSVKKDSWRTMPLPVLKDLLCAECCEFFQSCGRREAKDELVDIANICMMIYHKKLDENESMN